MDFTNIDNVCTVLQGAFCGKKKMVNVFNISLEMWNMFKIIKTNKVMKQYHVNSISLNGYQLIGPVLLKTQILESILKISRKNPENLQIFCWEPSE